MLEMSTTLSLECSRCNLDLGKETWQPNVEFGVELLINLNMHNVRIGIGCVENTVIKTFKVWPVVQGNHELP